MSADRRTVASVRRGRAGFDETALRAVCEQADNLRSGALMAVFRGHVILACGDVERPFEMHSVRKSLVRFQILVEAGSPGKARDASSLQAEASRDIQSTATIGLSSLTCSVRLIGVSVHLTSKAHCLTGLAPAGGSRRVDQPSLLQRNGS